MGVDSMESVSVVSKSVPSSNKTCLLINITECFIAALEEQSVGFILWALKSPNLYRDQVTDIASLEPRC